MSDLRTGRKGYPRKRGPASRAPVETVGVFGGTFNPPHIGHLVAAESAADQLKLGKLYFVPASIPPHKLDEKIVPAELRYEMLRLAIEGNSRFALSRIELDRRGPSYTVDTVAEIKTSLRIKDLYLIVGIDLLIDFHTWRSPDRILDECSVVAMNRPGFDLSSVDSGLLSRVDVITVPAIDISSTVIRRKINSGESIKYLVPPAVEDYILSAGLYR